MLPKDLTKDVIDRLSSIKGQIEGINRMLKEGKDPEKILLLFKAARKGLDAANIILLDEVYRKALAIKIVNASEACPGDCGSEKAIEDMKRQFPSIEQEELAKKISEISDLETRMKYHIKSSSQSK